MSNADRIEELRHKYEENPRRYFAPLANEFRKAGDLGQAIAICREHLPKQPGHMSGYIVFGQTLFEANNLEEARTVFEQALTLDPENLIALKHLGDIARMNGENSTARRWYARVLDADPRNDDIASQLASLGAPTPAIPVPVIPPPPAEAELDEKPGVFGTFDPNSLLDLPEDDGHIVSSTAAASTEPAHGGTAMPPSGGAEFDASQSELPDLDDIGFGSPVPPASAGTPAYGAPVATAAAPKPPFDARMEPLDLDFPESPEPASEDFEEGILAPQWPDTSELVARVQTPIRSATPLATPVVPASADTVQAFGRESSDPMESALLDIPLADGLVDAFLPPDQPAASSEQNFVTELDAAEIESAEFDSSIVGADEFDTPLAEVEHEIPVTAQENSGSLLDLHETPMPWEVAAEIASTAPASEVAVDSPPAETAVDDVAVPELAFADPVAQEEETAVQSFADERVVAEPASEVELIGVHDVESASDDVTTQDTQEFAIAGDWSVTPESHLPEPAAELEVAGEGWEAPQAEEEPVTMLVHTFDADLELPETRLAGDESFDDAGEVAAPAAASADMPDEGVVAESQAEPVALDLPEESYAEMSSEIANEREHDDAEAAALLSSEIEREFAASAAVAAPVEESEAPTFVTETMAELLLSQGHVSRAIEVYDELVRRRPNDVVLVARLQELRETERAETQRSESLRAELLRAESSSAHAPSVPTPAMPTAAITPLYSSPVRATPAFTPQLASSSGSFSAQANAQQAFRTARERFAELAARRVARRTPTHATAIADDPADGLSSLFGTSQPTTTDELAARALADAFGPVQDSGESLFDPSPMPTPAVPLRSLTPRSVSPVSAPAGTNSPQRSERQPASDYSFDKFFPDPAMTTRDAQPAHSSAATAQDPSQPVNEDLAQFSAWLKGLNNA